MAIIHKYPLAVYGDYFQLVDYNIHVETEKRNMLVKKIVYFVGYIIIFTSYSTHTL
jgi:hypothetical protein